MEITEQVKYGNRIVKCVRAEVVEAIGQDGQEANRLKPDFSLADEYENLKLIKQAKLARKEARTELLKKLGFRLLSEEEILAIGKFYADKIEFRRWSKIDKSDNFGGILSGLGAEDNGKTYTCNPWCKFNEMDTELIPLRIAQTLKTLEPLFDNIYIASTGQAENSMRMNVRRAYECPAGVGIAGENVALLARWGDYPPFLDGVREEGRITTILTKTLIILTRVILSIILGAGFWGIFYSLSQYIKGN